MRQSLKDRVGYYIDFVWYADVAYNRKFKKATTIIKGIKLELWGVEDHVRCKRDMGVFGKVRCRAKVVEYFKKKNWAVFMDYAFDDIKVFNF